MMNPTAVGLIVLACTLGGAMTGMWLRGLLPDHHVDSESKDTVKLGVGLIVTMTALILGLVIASAKSSFDAQNAATKHTAADLLTLDRTLARYGPETKAIREALQRAVAYKIDEIWPEDSSRASRLDPADASSAVEGLVDDIRTLSPRDARQVSLQGRALALSDELLEARWLVVTGAGSSVPLPFLVILLFWLTITFGCFGLFAPRNATVAGVLFLCSLSVTGAVFLILELETPFDGVVAVSSEPMRYANAHLNR